MTIILMWEILIILVLESEFFIHCVLQYNNILSYLTSLKTLITNLGNNIFVTLGFNILFFHIFSTKCLAQDDL